MPTHPYHRHRVSCSLTPTQHRQLTTSAQEHGAPTAAFVRDAALAYCGQRFLVPPGLQEQLASLIQETRRIGTNLNQIAAKANSLHRATLGDLRQAKRLTASFEEHVRHLQTALSNLSPTQ